MRQIEAVDSGTLQIRKSKLEGQVYLSGAKNSALRLLAASILTEEPIELTNFPMGLLDIQIHLKMLGQLGKVWTYSDKLILSNGISPLKTVLDWEGRSIRNTLLILGALTSRYGSGKVPLPGGCKLGDRKYDLHVMLLKEMGAEVWEEEGYLCASSKSGRLAGNDIYLPIRSTGATENAILCGILAQGETRIWNPHIRPEIMDLISMLSKMGAKIKVYGQQSIHIKGVDHLSGTKHQVIHDNMEALTWAIASVITQGDVEIFDFPFSDLEVPLVFLRESGMKFYKGSNSLIVRGGRPYPIEISTGPYPGINSDMQPLFAVYGALSKGISKIIDLRFPGRYAYAEELGKMGMDYRVEGELLIINGKSEFKGTTVKALDLRAGIALVLAGLTAEGETLITEAWQIERGYENLINKLNDLTV